MSEKLEEILSGGTKFDTPKRLNRSIKTVPVALIEKVEAGNVDLATLKTLTKDYPTYYYKSCITIHGAWPKVERERINGYKNVIQNQNGSLEILWSAVDTEAKQAVEAIAESKHFSTVMPGFGRSYVKFDSKGAEHVIIYAAEPNTLQHIKLMAEHIKDSAYCHLRAYHDKQLSKYYVKINLMAIKDLYRYMAATLAINPDKAREIERLNLVDLMQRENMAKAAEAKLERIRRSKAINEKQIEGLYEDLKRKKGWLQSFSIQQGDIILRIWPAISQEGSLDPKIGVFHYPKYRYMELAATLTQKLAGNSKQVIKVRSVSFDFPQETEEQLEAVRSRLKEAKISVFIPANDKWLVVPAKSKSIAITQLTKAVLPASGTQGLPADIMLVDYSPKSFALIGEGTKDIKEILLNDLKALWNSRLTVGNNRVAGWIVAKSRTEQFNKIFNNSVNFK